MGKGKTIKVLLADDHVLFREGLKALIGQNKELCVVGEASDGQQAIDLCETAHPDVVLMDIDMPHCNGITATQEIKNRWPEIMTIILSATCHDAQVYEAIESGASGFLQKNLEAEALFSAVKRVVRDGRTPLLDVSMTGKLFREMERRKRERCAERSGEKLSEREKEVLDLVKIGLTNKEIADELCLAPCTVKDHVSSLMRKLHLRNRVELAGYAYGEE